MRELNEQGLKRACTVHRRDGFRSESSLLLHVRNSVTPANGHRPKHQNIMRCDLTSFISLFLLAGHGPSEPGGEMTNAKKFSILAARAPPPHTGHQITFYS